MRQALLASGFFFSFSFFFLVREFRFSKEYVHSWPSKTGCENGNGRRRPVHHSRIADCAGASAGFFFYSRFHGSTLYGTPLRVLRNGCLALGKYLQSGGRTQDARHFFCGAAELRRSLSGAERRERERERERKRVTKKIKKNKHNYVHDCCM